MSTYLDIIPRELTLLILENLEFTDINSCIDHIDDVLAREFLLIHCSDFRSFYIDYIIQKLDTQGLSNQKLNIKELFRNLLLVYIKLDDEIQVDCDMHMSIIRSDNYVRSRGYYDENGTYHDRVLIYIRKNIEKEYADLLLEYSMELLTTNYLHINFLKYLFDNDAKYHIYLALQKFYHRFDYLKILGTSFREDLYNLDRFNSYLYRSGKWENIYCDEHKCRGIVEMNSKVNCKKCKTKVTYPPVIRARKGGSTSNASFLDHDITLIYIKLKVPSLLILIYYIDSLINSDIGRCNEIEEQLIFNITKEYQFTEEYMVNLFENHTKLKHLFPNEERVEYISMSDID